MDKGIFNETQKQQIEKIRKIFFRIAVYLFIGAVALGALLILIGGSDAGEYIGKTVGTLSLLGVALVVSSFNFQMLQSDRKSVQILALIGTATNVLWLLFWSLTIWNVAPFMEKFNCINRQFGGQFCEYRPSALAKISIISTILSVLGLFGAALMNIKEYGHKSNIRPLKITALVCLVFESAYSIILTLSNGEVANSDFGSRLSILASFAGVIWLIATVVAFFSSRAAENRLKVANKAGKAQSIEKMQETSASNQNPRPFSSLSKDIPSDSIAANQPITNTEETEAEMRARIEEKVRREMKIEAEIRARLKNEQAHEPQD